MMKSKTLIFGLLFALFCATATAAGLANTGNAPAGNEPQERKAEQNGRDHEEGSESAEKQSRLAKQAKISMEKAREIALQRAPGTVESAELEKEKGKLVYSFDIRNEKGTISEVWVDAKSGAIVNVEEENAEKEANEKREDEKNPGRKL